MNKNIYSLSDDMILATIGTKIKECRIAKNLTQAQLAQRCGLSAFSISQIETGHNTTLQSIVMVLRGLERLDLLDIFVQEAPINPIAVVEWQKKHPQHIRANGNNTTDNTDSIW